MTTTDFVILGVLVVIVGSAIGYIIKKKKEGVKCIGCPSGGKCCSGNGGECSCNCNKD